MVFPTDVRNCTSLDSPVVVIVVGPAADAVWVWVRVWVAPVLGHLAHGRRLGCGLGPGRGDGSGSGGGRGRGGGGDPGVVPALVLPGRLGSPGLRSAAADAPPRAADAC